MDGTKEVDCRFVVTRGDGAVLLESGKEVLDQVARLVQVTVVGSRVLARVFRGNDDAFSSLQQRLDHPLLRVVGLVGDDAGTRCVPQ